MNQIVEVLVLTCAMTGTFWLVMAVVFHRRLARKNLRKRAIIGLIHSSIYTQAMTYIKRHSITLSEYRNLMKLYEPYKDLCNSDMINKLVSELDKLPLAPDIAPVDNILNRKEDKNEV